MPETRCIADTTTHCGIHFLGSYKDGDFVRRVTVRDDVPTSTSVRMSARVDLGQNYKEIVGQINEYLEADGIGVVEQVIFERADGMIVLDCPIVSASFLTQSWVVSSPSYPPENVWFVRNGATLPPDRKVVYRAQST